MAPNIADLSHTKVRARPKFRGLPLYIGPKSLPLTSPTPARTPSQPTALRTRGKRRASDSQERGSGDGGGDGRLTPTEKALSPSVLVLVHLRPSSDILPLYRYAFLLLSSTSPFLLNPPSLICASLAIHPCSLSQSPNCIQID